LNAFRADAKVINLAGKIPNLTKNTSEHELEHGDIDQKTYAEPAFLWAILMLGCELVTTVIAFDDTPIKLCSFDLLESVY